MVGVVTGAGRARARHRRALAPSRLAALRDREASPAAAGPVGRIPAEARALTLRLARENPCGGAVRIRGELRTLRHDVSAETVRRSRLAARRRPPSQRWRTFLANHRHEIWAADFLTAPTPPFGAWYVFFVISHERRRIVQVHVTAHPTAPWVWQQRIEAMAWKRRPRDLIRDRDRAYGRDCVARARRLGIETVRIPIRAPRRTRSPNAGPARCGGSASTTSFHSASGICAASWPSRSRPPTPPARAERWRSSRQPARDRSSATAR